MLLISGSLPSSKPCITQGAPAPHSHTSGHDPIPVVLANPAGVFLYRAGRHVLPAPFPFFLLVCHAFIFFASRSSLTRLVPCFLTSSRAAPALMPVFLARYSIS